MSTFVLDTDVVSYIIRQDSRAEPYQRDLEGNALAISFMTVAELYEGACRAAWGRQKHEELAAHLRRYLVIGSTPSMCRLWGEVRTARRHRPISGADGWIAATALAYHCPLVTNNARDFVDIPGLEIITRPGK